MNNITKVILVIWASVVLAENIEPTDIEPTEVPELESVLLQITFSEQPQSGKRRVIGSSKEELPRLSVMNGQTVSFSRSSEPDYAVHTWAAVVSEIQEHQAVQVTPRFTGEQVSLLVIRDISQSGELTRLSTRITGRPGEWIPLFQPMDESGRVFRAGKKSDALYIRVDPARRF